MPGERRRVAPFMVVLPACLAVLLAPAGAASPAPPSSPPARSAATDPPGSDSPAEAFPGSTPRSAILGYIDACRRGDWKEAARFLELSGLPPKVRELGPETIARRFKTVLDQTLWVDPDRVSDSPEGNPADGKPDWDALGEIPTPRGSVTVWLHRVPEDGRLAWKVAARTLRHLDALYDEYGYGVLGEILAPPFFEIRALEIQLWQWIALLLLVVGCYVVSWILTAILFRVFSAAAGRTRTDIDDQVVRHLVGPARLLIALVFFSFGWLPLGLAMPARRFLVGLEKGLFVLVATWAILRLLDLAAGIVSVRLRDRGRKQLLSMVPLGRRTIKVVFLALALVALLQNLGFNVTSLVAGLGVGGLAVALAAQKTLENLFGGFTLITDQPVTVGDFCRFGDRVGTVEDIGLRSTKVRTLDRTLISIPNSTFSSMALENFGPRDRILLHVTIGLRYETSPDQLRWVLVELRKLLLGHPRIDNDPARARFVGFGASSLDIEIFAYARTNDWNEFLAIREDVFLRIMDIVDRSGSGFAFPSQTAYLARDGGLDPERSRRAEQEIRSLRAEGKLPFPSFPAEEVPRLENTVDWPPAGSHGKPLRGGPGAGTDDA